ncbi:putative ATP-binding cassette sub-family A member 3 [Operophtera brumata]|uniref:Putative ATP-binding cassette sub-family A member 3 n=1 Tax=Operophtera brumata TaxID=104452 RepID=A0A0L7K4B2_OPEBR|nr:putative ATP-binding cassette sub-family A member 3 [Operophtera brumata]
MLFQSLRGERTVLLTTHFMEEADALGDRVAALHQGHLRCHATPMHLKKAIGKCCSVAPRRSASLRGEHTVLLTTHFMEEADALGDRVAALHQGHLRCHATPMHLKKAIGTGYRLSFTTNGAPRDAAITRVVTSFVREATVKEKTINSLSYNLPSSDSSRFPDLFTALEEKKSELGIETIGVGVSTLEEELQYMLDGLVDSSQ